MPQKIATVTLNKKDAMDAFMSYERLRRTAGNENGPLQKIIRWFKTENARSFSLSNMHIGKPEEDYVLIYYFEGVRYKIDRDGHAYVSTADADVFRDELERDFQAMVDGILNDELVACVKALAKSVDAKVGGVKYRDADAERHTKAIMGIMK